MNIGRIITSKVPPVDKFVGWLKPVNGKQLELNFFIDGAWRPVSVGESSEESSGNGITEIECNATSPLSLSVTTEDNKATIVGYVDMEGYAQISDIPTKTSELENDSSFTTTTDLSNLESSLKGEIQEATEGMVTGLEVSGDSLLELNGSIDNGTAKITGSVDISTIPISDIDALFE